MKQRKIHPTAFCLRSTSFGLVTVLWSTYGRELKIRRILLSGLDHASVQMAGEEVFCLFAHFAKKIRNDKGYWNQIESYIKEHSIVEFSHSLCPENIKNLEGGGPA